MNLNVLKVENTWADEGESLIEIQNMVDIATADIWRDLRGVVTLKPIHQSLFMSSFLVAPIYFPWCSVREQGTRDKSVAA